jgi:hypothetical protein
MLWEVLRGNLVRNAQYESYFYFDDFFRIKNVKPPPILTDLNNFASPYSPKSQMLEEHFFIFDGSEILEELEKTS